MHTSSVNKTLFIAATHGDEPIGPALLERLADKDNLKSLYESVIGNPRALAQNKRFTKIDFNLAAPGDADSLIYEVARSGILVELFRQFDYIVDFHETRANNRIVLIIPRLCCESLALALSFDIEEILIWPSPALNAAARPLVQYAPFGVEIECGTKNSLGHTLNRLTKIVMAYLKNGVLKVEDNLILPPTEMEKKKFYLVYGRIEPYEVERINLKDHKEVDTGKEKFIALLFGKHQGLIGYKMRALDSREVLDMISFRKNTEENYDH